MNKTTNKLTKDKKMYIYLENCKVGDRIKFTKSFHYDKNGKKISLENKVWADRFPEFCLDITEHVGTVTEEVDDEYNPMMTVKLDKKYDDLEEWDNELYFYEEDLTEEILVEKLNYTSFRYD